MANNKRKNIPVFVTDDHAQWALGCYGNREIQSPKLDHLAATGGRHANPGRGWKTAQPGEPEGGGRHPSETGRSHARRHRRATGAKCFR